MNIIHRTASTLTFFPFVGVTPLNQLICR